MMKITLDPVQIQDSRIFPMAILATTLGTNPEWKEGRVTYKFDEYGVGLVPDEVVLAIVEVGGSITGMAFWVEVTDEDLTSVVPESFPAASRDGELRTWADYCMVDFGIHSKHLISVGYRELDNTVKVPAAETIKAMKDHFGNLIFNKSEAAWRQANQL